MKVISFNINSIRARLHQLEAIIKAHHPDVIGLQETKVHDEQFPIEAIEAMGYHAYFHGQKGHYGVATLSKLPTIQVERGFVGDSEETQRRAISTRHLYKDQEVMIFNGYFPQGESRDHPTKFPYKKWFYEELIKLLRERAKKPTIVMGDFNVSHQDIDIGIGDQNKKRWLRTGKCSFLPEEREWLNELFELGFLDTFRQSNPTVDDRFSWFDYRSKGFEDDPKRGLRIDLILATQELAANCIDSGIDYHIRGMEKPSDHCPIWAEFST